MPSMFVTLVGGPPWGFRIQGGSGTGLPLRLSKVGPESRAAAQGLLEGDLLTMVNGHLTHAMGQSEVRDIIREAGRSLTLEIDREPYSKGDREGIFTASKTMIYNTPVGYGSNLNHNNEFQNHFNQDEVNGYTNGHRERLSPEKITLYNTNSVRHPYLANGDKKQHFVGNTVITDQPPPPGAVLIDEKVTVDGDQLHRDKYYAIPVKEVLKEKTSETKFIKAPPKYEGIGPTEEGVPLSLRQSVKKENMSDWYKSMYKTLHKIDNEGDTYVIGYSSDPDVRKEEKKSPRKLDIYSNGHPKLESDKNSNIILHKYPTAVKSTISTYTSQPRSISDYEPGYSSVVDNKPSAISKRYLPSLNQTKPSYEVKDGYDSENYVLKRNLSTEPDPEQQKVWYRQVQQGGDIPQFGLNKPAPEKRSEPVIGPPPPVYYSPTAKSPEATRPLCLPPDYADDSPLSQQCNGLYANQMRQALHSELQQKGYQISSPTGRQNGKRTPTLLDKRVIARVLYNFTAESPREISLKKDDMVVIYRELDRNWYEGEYNSMTGIFPVCYVEIVPPEHTSQQMTETQGLAKVLYDFTAHTPVELTARKGDEIRLTRKVDNNWYEGKIGDKKGIIPYSYIRIIEEPGIISNVKSTPSPRLLEISRSSPISPVSSMSLSSPSIKSATPSSMTNGSSHIKKGSRLVEPVLYKALFRYTPQNADELELLDGDNVYVVEMCDDGWFVGTSVRTGELGIMPGNYMEKV